LKHAAILYWSNTGNTEKVAFAIKDGLEAAGVNVSILKTTEAEDIDYRDYDLVCVGSPSIRFHPPKQVAEFVLKKFKEHHKQGKVKTGAPKVQGKNALIFCTYSGPHTGLHEATPVGKYMGQFFEHLGFTVVDE
jgi:flavorubredoxin